MFNFKIICCDWQLKYIIMNNCSFIWIKQLLAQCYNCFKKKDDMVWETHTHTQTHVMVNVLLSLPLKVVQGVCLFLFVHVFIYIRMYICVCIHTLACVHILVYRLCHLTSRNNRVENSSFLVKVEVTFSLLYMTCWKYWKSGYLCPINNSFIIPS